MPRPPLARWASEARDLAFGGRRGEDGSTGGGCPSDSEADTAALLPGGPRDDGEGSGAPAWRRTLVGAAATLCLAAAALGASRLTSFGGLRGDLAADGDAVGLRAIEASGKPITVGHWWPKRMEHKNEAMPIHFEGLNKSGSYGDLSHKELSAENYNGKEGMWCRGIVATGFDHTPEGGRASGYTAVDHEKLRYFYNRGANCFRMPVSWERLQSKLQSEELDPLPEYEAAVEFITKTLDSYVIIFPHNHEGGLRHNGVDASLKDFEALWAAIARKWGSNPKVLFSLFKRPRNGQAQGHKRFFDPMPHDYDGRFLKMWFDWVQAAILKIREVGAKNLIMVTGSRWSMAKDWTGGFWGESLDRYKRGGNTRLAALVDPENHLAYDVHQFFGLHYLLKEEGCEGHDNNGYCDPPNMCGGADAGLNATIEWAKRYNKKFMMGEIASIPAKDGTESKCRAKLHNYLKMLRDSGVFIGYQVAEFGCKGGCAADQWLHKPFNFDWYGFDFARIQSGRCTDEEGSIPIVDGETCAQAAEALGLKFNTVGRANVFQHRSARPEGCYYVRSKQELWMSTAYLDIGNGADPHREPICMRTAQLSQGACADIGYRPIIVARTCNTVAKMAGMSDTRATEVDITPRPDGCYVERKTGQLFLSTTVFNKGLGADKYHKPICMAGLERASADFVRLTTGTCLGAGMVPIPDRSTCAAAATVLGLRYSSLQSTVVTPRPEGCFYVPTADLLFLSTSPANQGMGTLAVEGEDQQPICMRIELLDHHCTCEEHKMAAITHERTCNEAAMVKGLPDHSAQKTSASPRPEGCYYFPGRQSLWLSTNNMNRHNGGDAQRDPLCRVIGPPSNKMFERITTGTCIGLGMVPIVEPAMCAMAATELELAYHRVELVSETPRPEGCHYKKGTDLVYVSTDPANKNEGADNNYEQICMRVLLITQGVCDAYRMRPIMIDRTCTAAATAMRLPDKTPTPIRKHVRRPDGCYYDFNTNPGLFMSETTRNCGNGVVGGREVLCEPQGPEVPHDYAMASLGTCVGLGMVPIVDMTTCSQAALFLDLRHHDIKTTSSRSMPEGCHYESASETLWMSEGESSAGNGAVGDFQPLCMKVTLLQISKTKLGNCEEHGMRPIDDTRTCNSAAQALSLPDSTSKRVGVSLRPEGCYLYQDELFLAVKEDVAGNGAESGREPVCRPGYGRRVHES